MKKIKDLKLLGRHHPGGSFSGFDNLNIVSWADWILLDIKEDKLFLEVKRGVAGASQKSEIHFKREVFKKLNDQEREKIELAFKTNKGKTVKEVLNLPFVE